MKLNGIELNDQNNNNKKLFYTKLDNICYFIFGHSI